MQISSGLTDMLKDAVTATSCARASLDLGKIMSSDSDLKKAVLDELGWEPSVNETHIGVTAHAGVVHERDGSGQDHAGL
jgi:hypothetical protein